MRRRGHVAFVLALLTAVGAAEAQQGRIDFVSSGPVTFTVSDADLAAAKGCSGCIVVPADPGAGVVLDVRRQNPNSVYAIDVSLDGWTPAGGPTLEVQATVTSTNGRTTYLQTGWMVLGTAPTLVLDQRQVNQSRVHVAVAYRLRLDGDEAAGTFVTPITYRIRGTTQAVAHTAQVVFPSFLALRWVGVPAAGTPTLRFDYANEPAAFVRALTTGVPLAPTSADFDRLEASTNHPTGYSVVVVLVPLETPPGSSGLAPRLTIAGVPIEQHRFVSAGPTDGYVTLATPTDFALAVDGREVPGTYRIELRYEATRNP